VEVGCFGNILLDAGSQCRDRQDFPLRTMTRAGWPRRYGDQLSLLGAPVWVAPDVVGRTLTLNGTTYTILGVTAAGILRRLDRTATSLWIPIAMQSQVMLERPGLLDNPNAPWVRIIARVKSGMTITQAQAAAQVLNQQILRD